MYFHSHLFSLQQECCLPAPIFLLLVLYKTLPTFSWEYGNPSHTLQLPLLSGLVMWLHSNPGDSDKWRMQTSDDSLKRRTLPSASSCPVPIGWNCCGSAKLALTNESTMPGQGGQQCTHSFTCHCGNSGVRNYNRKPHDLQSLTYLPPALYR